MTTWHGLTPKWVTYLGNNHNRIEDPGFRAGGYVSFTKHLGRPLSDELWEDLVARCGIVGLRIYSPGEGQWCDGPGPGDCIINLDSNGLVWDIHLCPYNRPFE